MSQLQGKTIVYIAGYGRSGSTLLCAVLGASENAVGVGEFRRLFSCYTKKSHFCGCGVELRDCEFWGKVIRRFKDENELTDLTQAEQVTKRCEQGGGAGWLPSRMPTQKDWAEYQRIWSSLISITCEIAGVDILIDSSKSSYVSADRARLLSKFVNVVQVHLVRDPRAVTLSTLNSQKKREQRAQLQASPFRAVQSLLGWTLANAYFLLITQHVSSMKSVRVRYEDFTQHSVESIERLGRECDLDTSTVLTKLRDSEEIVAGHIFAGDNNLKHGGGYIIRPVGESWRQNLTGYSKYLAFITYPVARAFGYMKLFS